MEQEKSQIRLALKHWTLLDTLEWHVDQALLADSRHLDGAFQDMYDNNIVSILVRKRQMLHAHSCTDIRGKPIHEVAHKHDKGKRRAAAKALNKRLSSHYSSISHAPCVTGALARLYHVLRVRISKLSGIHISQITRGKIHALITNLAEQPGMISVAVLRVWLHGCTTSQRMQLADRLPCMYCFRRRADTLHHYIRCPRLWGLLNDTCGTNLTTMTQRLALSLQDRPFWTMQCGVLCAFYRLIHASRHTQAPLTQAVPHIRYSFSLMHSKGFQRT